MISCRVSGFLILCLFAELVCGSAFADQAFALTQAPEDGFLQAPADQISADRIAAVREAPGERIKRRIQRRRERQSQKQEAGHWPDYDACQDMEEQPFFLDNTEEKTEGRFCFFCDRRAGAQTERATEESLKPAAAAVSKKSFQERLRSRIKGLTEARIYEIRLMRHCVQGAAAAGGPPFNQVDPQLIEAVCRQKKEAVQNAAGKRSLMRERLALSSPRLRHPDFLNHPGAYWQSLSPSHPLPDLPAAGKLNPQEQKKVFDAIVKTLAETPLEGLDSAALKERLENNRPLFRPVKGDKRFLGPKDKQKLMEALRALSKENRTLYYELLTENPLSAYLSSDQPSQDEQDQALEKMENNLSSHLKTVASADTEALLSAYRPLAEELLAEAPEYCRTAERARLKAEKDQASADNLFLGASLAGLAPCFAGGFVAVGVCIAVEGGLVLYEMRKSGGALRESFARALTGRNLEAVSHLEEKQKDHHFNTMLFPLLLLEAGAVVRAGKQIRKSAARRGASSDAKD